MNCVTLCLDIGGTEIKAAPVQNGTLLSPIQYFPANAHGSFEELSAHFSHILRTLYQLAPEGSKIDGVHFAFPGPFDYENGVCLIEGLDKYEAFFQKICGSCFFLFAATFCSSLPKFALSMMPQHSVWAKCILAGQSAAKRHWLSASAQAAAVLLDKTAHSHRREPRMCRRTGTFTPLLF